MKIAIIGSNGMLGYAMREYFKKEGHSVLCISRAEYDIATQSLDTLFNLLSKQGTEIVINCAGVIKPQIAKTTIEHVLRVNSIFPYNLAKHCNAKNIKAFHITTDCVYSGLKGNYSESDFFDATDVYGMSKNAGEPNQIMTLRTSIIGEEEGQSRSLLEWARSQKGKTVNGFVDHSWNGVTTLQLAKTIDEIIKKNAWRPGVFHVHSPKAVTKLELLKIFNRAYELNLDIQEKNAPEFCDRTLSSNFSIAKDFVRDEIEAQVKTMRDFFKN